LVKRNENSAKMSKKLYFVTKQDLEKIAQKLQHVKQAGNGSVLIRVEKHEVEYISFSIGEKVKSEVEKTT